MLIEPSLVTERRPRRRSISWLGMDLVFPLCNAFASPVFRDLAPLPVNVAWWQPHRLHRGHGLPETTRLS
jgi:hypothetical protein